jgi:hypothetical protein
MDRKIEIDALSEDLFQDMLLAVNSEVFKIAKEAQDKINELLHRFNVACELSLNYSIPLSSIPVNEINEINEISEIIKNNDNPNEAATPIKKKRTRKIKEKKEI